MDQKKIELPKGFTVPAYHSQRPVIPLSCHSRKKKEIGLLETL